MKSGEIKAKIMWRWRNGENGGMASAWRSGESENNAK
jgi:hypothetical protein